MLIRGDMFGVHGGAVQTACPEAIPAASITSLSTLLLGGLLLISP